MQAAVVTECGGPEVLVTSEQPDPEAGPGEAVIDVAAADAHAAIEDRGVFGKTLLVT